jgi:hypothetical protein
MHVTLRRPSWAGARWRLPSLALAAALLGVVAVDTARAAPSCSTGAGTTTCTFASTGAEDSFTVPAGVGRIEVVAVGAPGAVGLEGGAAGRGAIVTGELTVTAGQTVHVNVGGAPSNPPGACHVLVACVGGFNGGGSSRFGGGGAGPRTCAPCPAPRAERSGRA